MTMESKFLFAPGSIVRGPVPPSKGEDAITEIRSWALRNPGVELPDSLLPLAVFVADEALWALAGDRVTLLILQAQAKKRIARARRSYSGLHMRDLTHLATIKALFAIAAFMAAVSGAHAGGNCRMPDGRGVPCEHFITTNSADEAARQAEIRRHEFRARERIRREREGALQDDANGNGGRR